MTRVTEAEPESEPKRLEQFALVALVVLVAAPAVALGVSALRSGWIPYDADKSAMWVRTREVGTRHTPFVGAYSRYGWNHPGPLEFWVSAPVVRLFGPVGLMFTAALVNAAAGALAVVAGFRAGRLACAAPAAVAAAVMMHAMTSWGLVEPWNPYVAVLPFLAFVLCAWGAANGDKALLVAAVITGSWCAQAHLGFVPLTLAVAGLAVGWRVGWKLQAEQREPIPGRWMAAATALGLLLWLPPILDQLTPPAGNLGALLFFIRSGRTPDGLQSHPVGLRPAVHAAAGYFGPDAPWMRPADPMTYKAVPYGSLLGVGLLGAAFAFIGLLAWHRCHRRAAGLVALSLVLIPLSVVAMARTADELLGYVLRWTWGVAAVGWIAAAWAGLELLGPRIRQVAGSLACVVVVGLGAATLQNGLIPDLRLIPGTDAVGQMTDGLVAHLDPDTTYLLTAHDTNWYYLVLPGIAVNLMAHDEQILVDGGLRLMFKDWLVSDGSHSRQAIVIVPAFEAAQWKLAHPEARLVASYHPRTPAAVGDPLFAAHDAWLLPATADFSTI